MTKATGIGVNLPRSLIAVDREAGGTAFSALLRSFRLTPDHLAAVAVLGAPEPVTIRLEEVEP